MGEYEYKDFSDFLAFDNAENLSFDHTLSEVDIFEDGSSKMVKDPFNLKDQKLFGISNACETFMSKKELSFENSDDEMQHTLRNSLTRKNTENSDMRKSSIASSSSHSLDMLKLINKNEEPKLLGKKKEKC